MQKIPNDGTSINVGEHRLLGLHHWLPWCTALSWHYKMAARSLGVVVLYQLKFFVLKFVNIS